LERSTRPAPLVECLIAWRNMHLQWRNQKTSQNSTRRVVRQKRRREKATHTHVHVCNQKLWFADRSTDKQKNGETALTPSHSLYHQRDCQPAIHTHIHTHTHTHKRNRTKTVGTNQVIWKVNLTATQNDTSPFEAFQEDSVCMTTEHFVLLFDFGRSNRIPRQTTLLMHHHHHHRAVTHLRQMHATILNTKTKPIADASEERGED
jgi:hypothetical protein